MSVGGFVTLIDSKSVRNTFMARAWASAGIDTGGEVARPGKSTHILHDLVLAEGIIGIFLCPSVHAIPML
jgi:hypothetical protein